MKICVVGAGSVGGVIGAKLARAGQAVSLVARGAHLAAMRAHGLTLETGGERYTLRLAASDDPAAFGPQDIVILTVKAPALREILPRLAPLLGPDTAVATAMNGLPWWFFDGFVSPFDAAPRAVDPNGSLAAAVRSGVSSAASFTLPHRSRRRAS